MLMSFPRENFNLSAALRPCPVAVANRRAHRPRCRRMALHEADDGHHGGAQKAMGTQDDGLKEKPMRRLVKKSGRFKWFNHGFHHGLTIV